MTNDLPHKQRSLIMAGGGIKVAFQAGVLQVWLDEAGLKFDHADGASGGLFNLSMYCQGMSGTEIADNWRNFNPLRAIDLNWKEYFKLFWGVSFLKYDRFRKNILTRWRLDWDKINTSDREATFNIYNFTKQKLLVASAAEMSEDHLIAGVSLPIWFPPVEIDGDQYLDSVYVTDANIAEAIRRGADELWIIWTVSQRGIWRGGLIPTYFQIIETAADGPYNSMIARIRQSNALIAAGQAGEFGRHIDVKILQAEVPLHYLFNFSRAKVARAVDLGVRMARAWCVENGIVLENGGHEEPAREDRPTALSFSETMKGFVGSGTDQYEQGYLAGKDEGNDIEMTLTIEVDDIARFLSEPSHAAKASGVLRGSAVSGTAEVEDGIFNLFVEEKGGLTKYMNYLLPFERDGEKFTLSGKKIVKDDPGLDVWADTTTLYTRILRGHVAPEDKDDAEIVAAGIIRIHFMDFLKQLTTFDAKGPSSTAERREFLTFAKFFLGSLWDVYGPHVSQKN